MNPSGNPSAEALTEVPSEDPAADIGVASPPPASLVFVMWLGVFSVLTWGLAALFRGRRWSADD